MANASGGGGGKGGAIRAGRAFVELSAEDAGLRSGLEKARKAVLGFGKGLAVGGAGVAGVGALITGPILGAMHEAVERFNEVRKAADQLGTTPEIFSGLAFAVKRFGIDSDGLVVASRHMNKFIAEAKDGGGAAEDLNKLGLSAADLINLPLDEQFKAIASGIAALGTEAERQEATLKVFGRSGGALAPLMRGGAAGIADLLAKAKDIGAIVTQQNADDAKKFSGSLKEIKASIGFLIESVGASVLPQMAEQMKTVADNIVPLVKSARLFIEENRALVVGVLAVGTAITAAGTGLVMLGSGIALAAVAAGGLATALSVAGTVLAVVFSPVGLGIATMAVAAVLVAALVAEFADLSGAVGALKFIWGGLSETFAQTWAGIRDALSAGDLQLAFKIAVAGLDVIWKGYLLGLEVAWAVFKETFLDGWRDMVTEVRVMVANMLRDFAQVDVLARTLGKVLGFGTEAEIRAKAAADKAAAAAARKDDIKERINALVDAKGDLRDLKDDARTKAATAAGIKWFQNLFSGSSKVPQQAIAAQMAALASGTFSTFGNAAGMFGVRQSPLEKIADNTKRAADDLDAIREDGAAKFN